MSQTHALPGVPDSCIAERFIAGETLAALAQDFGARPDQIEAAIRAWAQPYWYFDRATSELFNRLVPDGHVWTRVDDKVGGP